MLLKERMQSVMELPEEKRWEDFVARTHGVRFTVTDMGNGVLRVEHALLDPIDFLERDAERHGRYRMDFPFPGWMLDAVTSAVVTVGVYPCPLENKLSSLAYARPIRDRVIEIIGWRHPSYFEKLAEAAGIKPA